MVVARVEELELKAAGPLRQLDKPPRQSRLLAGVLDLQIPSNKDQLYLILVFIY